MRATSTQVGLQLGADLSIGGVRISFQQRLCTHHHPRDAVPTRRSLLLDEGPLQWAWILETPQPLESRNLPSFQQHDRCYARQRRSAVDQHRARAALTEATT